MIAEKQLLTYIAIEDNNLVVNNLCIDDPELVEYMRAFPQHEYATRLNDLINIGLVCVQRTSAMQDTEFVKRRMDAAVNTVETALDKLPELLKTKITRDLGTEEGQVLYPVTRILEDVQLASKTKFDELREFISNDIDPTKDGSKVSEVFKRLEKFLDPDQVKSVPSIINKTLNEITDNDGVLTKHVNEAVKLAVKPLQEDLASLSKELLKQEAASDVLQQTTVKGLEYEDVTVARLQQWASMTGSEVNHIGSDNKTGDILLTIPDTSIAGVDFSIVIETRDRQAPKGRKQITEHMSKCMSSRSASYGIYLSRFPEGLAAEIGEWAEGKCEAGNWIATTDEYLHVAIRLHIVNNRLLSLKEHSAAPDFNSMGQQINRIETSLKRLATINSKVTVMRKGADDIRTEAETLRDEIQDALSDLENALNVHQET